MQIDFTGRQIEITPDLRHYTEERLSKVARLLRDQGSLHVILAAERHLRIAEITLNVRDHALVGVGQTADPRLSISGAFDKLEKQVVKLLERRRTRKRRPKPTSAILLNVLRPDAVDHDHEPIETEHIAIKPLSVEEAIELPELVRRGAVVFRNSETERVNVIYRRPDGKLALIEPEP
jgi:putative sigma-54 modulation protein